MFTIKLPLLWEQRKFFERLIVNENQLWSTHVTSRISGLGLT